MSFSREKEGQDGAYEETGAFCAPSARTCPTCGRDISDSLYLRESFCSRKCREIDLMKWLNEEYRLPVDDHFLPEGEADEQE
ncbi:MAG: DNA gyrase inhibitor YacG [Leptospirillum sp.]